MRSLIYRLLISWPSTFIFSATLFSFPLLPIFPLILPSSQSFLLAFFLFVLPLILAAYGLLQTIHTRRVKNWERIDVTMPDRSSHPSSSATSSPKVTFFILTSISLTDLNFFASTEMPSTTPFLRPRSLPPFENRHHYRLVFIVVKHPSHALTPWLLCSSCYTIFSFILFLVLQQILIWVQSCLLLDSRLYVRVQWIFSPISFSSRATFSRRRLMTTPKISLLKP